jgi:hypothetical protein
MINMKYQQHGYANVTNHTPMNTLKIYTQHSILVNCSDAFALPRQTLLTATGLRKHVVAEAGIARHPNKDLAKTPSKV